MAKKTGSVEGAAEFGAETQDFVETIFATFADQAETLRKDAEALFDGASGAFETAGTRFEAIGADFVDAARAEAVEAADFANELARATSFANALEIQRGYWTKLVESRLERGRSIAIVTAAAARESLEPFSKAVAASSFAKLFPFAEK